TIESVAENLGDSIVAPVLAFAARGLPGAAVYRVVNTADAMFGYRDDREWLGKSAARADDVLNVVPSRVAAAALAAAALALEGPARARAAVAAARRDHGALASPNAGWPIGAMAGALGCRLDKPGHYVVGRDWPAPTARDVRRAAGTAGLAAALVAGTVSVTAC
ncbi:MAG TPA: CobD/CbiB family cobalamin biosynthesis protein, partial [Solirubrobacteraceae bacterium]|nr:CobD/CbiB family cobalamin biosynthesis protein [Solirubrobacteraceae bacterium]